VKLDSSANILAPSSNLVRCVCALATLGLLLFALAPAAQTWRGDLSQGGSIVVDPDTRRALREEGGSTRPLWDGVHRLEDGSTVIVRDGVAVPTRDMVDAWSGARPPEPLYEDRWCMQLVRKTCGFDDACISQAACLQARTLLADVERERRDLAMLPDQGMDAAAPVPTEERCRQALSEAAFPACASLTRQGDGRCRALVTQACGAADACAGSAACDAARQLELLETEERLAVADPSGRTDTGGKCIEAMSNAFFAPCAASSSD
jgi:hypothetical protein